MFTFNAEAAQRADRGGFITTGGVYRGQLKSCKVFSKDSGSKGIEFSFEDNDGATVNYLQIYTTGKDGQPLFGKDKISALLGLFSMQSVNVSGCASEGFTIPALCDKNIAIQIQREEYYKNDGDVGYKFNLLSFLDHGTLKTYNEKINNLAASVAERKIKDKLVSPKQDGGVNNRQDANDKAPFPEDDLPF